MSKSLTERVWKGADLRLKADKSVYAYLDFINDSLCCYSTG